MTRGRAVISQKELFSFARCIYCGNIITMIKTFVAEMSVME